ncbi:MAG: hypothetical protein RIR26_1695, partial [Pseudomonadota bacterium]
MLPVHAARIAALSLSVACSLTSSAASLSSLMSNSDFDAEERALLDINKPGYLSLVEDPVHHAD